MRKIQYNIIIIINTCFRYVTKIWRKALTDNYVRLQQQWYSCVLPGNCCKTMDFHVQWFSPKSLILRVEQIIKIYYLRITILVSINIKPTQVYTTGLSLLENCQGTLLRVDVPIKIHIFLFPQCRGSSFFATYPKYEYEQD